MFVDKLSSGRIVARLRPRKTRLGNWAIEVKLFHRDTWEPNISLPMFNDKESAKKWLADNYEFIKEDEDE